MQRNARERLSLFKWVLGDGLYFSATVTIGLAVSGTAFVTVGLFLQLSPSPWLHQALHDPRPWVTDIVGISYILIAGVSGLAWSAGLRNRREEVRRLHADSLPERATHAAQVLQEATTLVEELQAELTARTALLEDVRRQVAETTERAADMEILSQVDAETTRVLNKYFDEALEHRLHHLEHSARGREWLIGTVVALVVGVGAILLSHYVLGF